MLSHLHRALASFNPLRGLGPRRTSENKMVPKAGLFQSAPRLGAAENQCFHTFTGR